MTNHKSRIWRDIDKHPLPENDCEIDVKLDCGSVLIGCRRRFRHGPCSIGTVHFNGLNVELIGSEITQWRDAK